jgi:Bacterial PH domain
VFHRSAAARANPATRPGPAVPDREVFRLVTPVVLWWVWVAFAAANVADFAVQGGPGRFEIVVLAVIATVTGLAYALALRPRVVADPAGLRIVNPFRDHGVPWSAIQTVDTGDWVRVHYAPGPAGYASPSSAASKAISCWALYISARIKRRQAGRGLRSNAVPSVYRGRLRHASLAGGLDPEPGYAAGSRLPDEARYLASLPAAQAIAVRLDSRAARERKQATPANPAPTDSNPAQADSAPADSAQADSAQADSAQVGPAQASSGRPGPPGAVTARWAWFPLAAVVLPALTLLIILLA